MAHPGRPRRRTKINNSTHHQAPPLQQQQLRQGPAKEEPSVQLHDEADLISFRTDALNRYITNQEYLENVTSKFVHSSKIIPPSLYPTLPKRTEEDFKKLGPEEIYFGDLNLMRLKEKGLKNEVSNDEESPYLLNDKEYIYQRESVDKLSSLQSKLFDKESMNNLEEEVNKILKDYENKFNKVYKSIPSVNKYSVPIRKISNEVNVASAPEYYNPRSINSFININNEQEPNEVNATDINNNNALHLNNNIVDTSQFSASNGMFIDSFGNTANTNDFHSNGNIHNNFTMAMVNNNSNLSNNNNGHIANANNDQQVNEKEQSSIVDDEINQLFNENGSGEIDPTQSAIVNDDMGDLINFQGDGDDGMMASGTFDQDFLSQIDHSME